MSDSTPKIVNQLRTDVLKARKARDQVTSTALQSVLAAIDNAGAVSASTDIQSVGVGSTEIPRRELTEQDIHKLLRQEISELQGAIEAFGSTRNAYVDELHNKLVILEKYL